jgi:hypothetical protein
VEVEVSITGTAVAGGGGTCIYKKVAADGTDVTQVAEAEDGERHAVMDHVVGGSMRSCPPSYWRAPLEYVRSPVKQK